jgi:hypothetical protein
MIGVDLGTTTVRIHLKGKGVVLREPAVIAVVKGSTDVKAVGEEAYRMLGRTPGNVMAVRPMADGVIADYTLTEIMLKAFIRKVLSGPARFLRPTIMVCIPSGITEVEKRAVVQAVHEIGARKALLIEEPIAGAIGAGIRIEEPVGTMVIDVGGGTTDIAVLSMGGIVVSESLRVAGNTFDRDIMAFVKARHNLLIGDRTAEEIKRTVGAAMMPGGGDTEEMGCSTYRRSLYARTSSARCAAGGGGVAADDVDAVAGGLPSDALGVAFETEVTLANVEDEVLAHLVLRQRGTDLQADGVRHLQAPGRDAPRDGVELLARRHQSASRWCARSAANSGLRQATSRSPGKVGVANSTRFSSSNRLACKSPLSIRAWMSFARKALIHCRLGSLSWNSRTCLLVIMPRSPTSSSCCRPNSRARPRA